MTERQRHRLMSRVRVHAGCWGWAGAVNKNGYATFTASGHQGRAALWVRIALGMAVPRSHIGEKLVNTCGNKTCVNPAHNIPQPLKSKQPRVCERGHRLDDDGECPQCRELERARQRRSVRMRGKERLEFEAWARELRSVRLK